MVVGEGDAADGRAARLRDAGAVVERVGPADWSADRAAGAWLVLCQDEAMGPVVAADARAAGALVWVHDQPDRSDLTLPALARRGALQVAISTDGRSPALAGRLKLEIQRLLDDAGPALDDLIDGLEGLRGGPDARAALRAAVSRVRLTGRLLIDG